MMEVILAKITDLDERQCAPLLRYLSAQKQKRIPRYRRVQDRLRAFLGEVLLQVYAMDRWSLTADDIVLHQTEHEKPYLLNHPEHQFNISHSGDWVACAFHDSSVGIDIEQIRAMDLTIAEQCYSPMELDYLQRQLGPKRLSSFFRLWTLKESYIKARGEGLSIALDSFAFDLTEGTVFTSGSDVDDWSFQCYSVLPEYELAVCARGLNTHFPDTVQLTTGQDLVARFSNLMHTRMFP